MTTEVPVPAAAVAMADAVHVQEAEEEVVEEKVVCPPSPSAQLLRPQFAHRTEPTCQSDNDTVV
jgi:hypothetical protein